MIKVEELQTAVKRLSTEDLEIFRNWFEEYEAKKWDQKIEKDIKAGKLDTLAMEAIKEFKEGNFSEI